MKKTWTLLAFMATTILSFAQDPTLNWAGLFNSTDESSPRVSDVARDSSGNYFVVGYIFFTGDTVDFDLGLGENLQTSTGGNSSYCAKYTNNGQLLWVKLIGTTSNGENRALSVVVRPSQDVLVGGEFVGNVDFDPGQGVQSVTSFGTDYYILRLSGATGDYVSHSAQPEQGNQTFRSLQQDENGAIYFSYRSIISNSVFEIIQKISATSNWQYYVTASDPSNLDMQAFKVDTANGVYFVGNFRNSIRYNSNDLNQQFVNPGSTEMVLIRIDNAGQYASSKRVDASGSISSAITDNEGNLFLGGYCQTSASFGNNITIDASNPLNAYKFFLVKYNNAGLAQWAKIIDGDQNFGSIISMDDNKNLYFAIYYFGTVDVDLDSIGVKTLTSTSGAKQALLKLTKNGEYVGVAEATAVNDVQSGYKVIGKDIFNFGYCSNDSIDLNIGAAVNQYVQKSPAKPTVFFLSKHSMPNCDATVAVTQTGLSANIDDAVSYEWIDCATNQVIGTAKSITLSTNTTARVNIEKGFCSTQSLCTQFTVGNPNVGILGVESPVNVTIYPNPTSNVLNVVSDETILKMDVINLLGEVVLSVQGATVIDPSTLANATYILKLQTTSNKTAYKRFVKQ